MTDKATVYNGTSIDVRKVISDLKEQNKKLIDVVIKLNEENNQLKEEAKRSLDN